MRNSLRAVPFHVDVSEYLASRLISLFRPLISSLLLFIFAECVLCAVFHRIDPTNHNRTESDLHPHSGLQNVAQGGQLKRLWQKGFTAATCLHDRRSEVYVLSCSV